MKEGFFLILFLTSGGRSQPNYSQVCKILGVFSGAQEEEYAIIKSPGLSFYFKNTNPNPNDPSGISKTIKLFLIIITN